MKNSYKLMQIVLCFAIFAAILSCATSGPVKPAPVLATGEWMTYNDRGSDGGSSISELNEIQEEINGEMVTVYHVTGNVTEQFEYGFAGWGLDADDATYGRYKTADALSFYILGDGKKYTIKFKIDSVTDYAYHEYTFETTAGEAEYIEVPMMFFMQPAWGNPIRFDQTLVTGVEWQTHESWRPDSFEIKMWNFKIHQPAPVKSSGKPAPVVPVPGGTFEPFTLELTDNFEYGNGYQGALRRPDLMNGYRIRAGETYTLKITYSASRDLENDLCIGFADTTPTANYWKALSWNQRGDESPDVVIPASKAGEVVTAEVTITTIAAATGGSPAANTLIFETVGAGRKGAKGSGVQGKVTLSITEFVFAKQ